MQQQKHLVLIDGYHFFFRAFHAVRALNRSDGLPTNALYGFAQMLIRVVRDLQPTHCAVALDSKEPSFRHEMFPAYKANRPEPHEDLKAQFPYVQELIEGFDIPALKQPGVEADDIIATLATQYKGEYKVTIVSSDKDLYQLIDDASVTLRDTMKQKTIDSAAVMEKFGVTPEQVGDLLALVGDSSDNIPGVPGVGPKTAATLLQQYGTMQEVFAHVEDITKPKLKQNLTEHVETAKVSRTLVELKRDVELSVNDHSLSYAPDFTKAAAALEKLEFNSLASRLLANGTKPRAVHPAFQDVPPPATAPQEEQQVVDVKAEYQCLDTVEKLKSFIAKCREAGVCAVDTETTSLHPREAKLVGIALAYAAGKAGYVPLAHQTTEGLDFGDGSGIQQLSLKETQELLNPLLADTAVRKVGHNLKYDWQILKAAGFELANYDDTLLMSYVLDAGMHNHGLDDLAKRYFEHEMIPFKEVCGTGKKQITIDLAPLETVVNYAAEDADYTWRLHDLLSKRLHTEEKQRQLNLYQQVELKLLPVMAQMEWTGIAVDQGVLNTLSQDFAERITALEKQVFELAGKEFNVNSPAQLGVVLFDELELSVKGKNKARSTNVQVLEELAEQGHEIAAKVIEFRQLSKLRSTYTEALAGQINSQTQRVHTSFNAAGAATGRLSSSDPNLQNIPIRTEDGRKIRQAFVAAPGHVLVSADYSQIELRLLAHFADVKPLQEAFKQNADIHSFTAAQVFNVPRDEVTSDQRRMAKVVNYGLLYGMGPLNLGRQLGLKRGEAQDLIDQYFERMPGVRQFMQAQQEFARQHGYVQTLLGRRVYLPDIHSKQPQFKAGAERAAINAPLQGSNADIIKLAMVELMPKLVGTGTKLLLQVHDELICEVPEEQLSDMQKLIVDAMENVVQLSVPLKVDAGSAPDWDAAH